MSVSTNPSSVHAGRASGASCTEPCRSHGHSGPQSWQPKARSLSPHAMRTWKWSACGFPRLGGRKTSRAR